MNFCSIKYIFDLWQILTKKGLKDEVPISPCSVREVVKQQWCNGWRATRHNKLFFFSFFLKHHSPYTSRAAESRNPHPATKRSWLSQLSHEELQNVLRENTIFMTRVYNNAKMQWPCSGENMLETVWYDPLCLYCSGGGSGAQSLQGNVHLNQLSCWLFTHIYQHSCDEVGSGVACTNHHFCLSFLNFSLQFFHVSVEIFPFQHFVTLLLPFYHLILRLSVSASIFLLLDRYQRDTGIIICSQSVKSLS